MDVFILDNLPNNEKKRTKFCNKLAFFQRIWTHAEYQHKTKQKKFKALVKDLLYSFLAIPGSRFWAKKLDRLAQKYKNTSCDLVSSLTFTGANVKREEASFPIKMLTDFIEHRFESNLYPIPKDYDKYLTILYGDWRQLPPLEKRISNHLYVVDYIKE